MGELRTKWESPSSPLPTLNQRMKLGPGGRRGASCEARTEPWEYGYIEHMELRRKFRGRKKRGKNRVLRARKESLPPASPSSLLLAGHLWHFLAYRCSTLIFAFMSTWCSPCMCVCVQISPFSENKVTLD